MPALRFESTQTIYRAPGFTAEEISFLNAIVSSHIFSLGTRGEIATVLQLQADGISSKLRDLLSYMKEVQVSEIDCCAEGKPKEVVKIYKVENYPFT
jgi:hypothetical protein